MVTVVAGNKTAGILEQNVFGHPQLLTKSENPTSGILKVAENGLHVTDDAFTETVAPQKGPVDP
jgi:hypothetical protein